MKTFALVRLLAATAAAVCFTSCEGGGGSDGSPSNGNIGVVLCLGDSITEGRSPPAGAPYPARLAGLCGKTVINAGQGGEKSSSTAGRAPGLLAKHNPGYLCLMIGANDATAAFSPAHVAENVRKIIQAGKAQGSIVLVGTITPAYEPHGFSEDQVVPINVAIRAVVREEGARLVDIEAEFGTARALIQDDGLHPSDAGTQIIAAAFNDKL